MKILFICGSIEPGRDGVGDYVRMLSNKLLERGHLISILALNDRQLTGERAGEEIHAGLKLHTLSIPASFKASKRGILAKRFVSDFQPDIISLQFVIFSFHKKGLPFNLANEIYRISPQGRWHIMFHEIWIGLQKHAAVKFRLWGFLQKLIISSLIRKIKPVHVHTQTRLYQTALLPLFPDIRLLPLFSNISPPQITTRRTSKALTPESGQNFRFIIFGTIHPEAPISVFANEAASYAVNHNCRFIFQFIGRNGAQLSYWQQTLERAGFECQLKGELSADKIAIALDGADAGISSSAYITIEKSGTVAAFKEFGLPVLCIARFWKPRIPFNFRAQTGIVNYEAGALSGFFEHIYEPDLTNLDHIAGQFINEL